MGRDSGASFANDRWVLGDGSNGSKKPESAATSAHRTRSHGRACKAARLSNRLPGPTSADPNPAKAARATRKESDRQATPLCDVSDCRAGGREIDGVRQGLLLGA